MVNATPWLLYPREREPVPIVQEVAWAPRPVWMGAGNLSQPMFDPWTAQFIASHYTNYTISAEHYTNNNTLKIH